MHKGVAETAGMLLLFFCLKQHLDISIPVIGTPDELTGQAVVAFVTLKP